MATRKQIAANRRNAKKSTGPRTPEGKAASARNATKHGLLSRQALLADENESEFVELRIQIHGELAPMGALETVLVNRIAAQQWRLARVPALEAELFERLRYDALGNDDGLGAAWARDAGPYGGALARLARYETMLDRSTARLLADLRRLQAGRRQADGRELRAAQGAAQSVRRGAGLSADTPWRERMEDAWPGAPHPAPAYGGSTPLHPVERGHEPHRVDGDLSPSRRAPPSPLGGEGGRGDEDAPTPPAFPAKFPNEADGLTLPDTAGLGAGLPDAAGREHPGSA
jgi:hypothetical protein